jgi:predicted transcriptional regulator
MPNCPLRDFHRFIELQLQQPDAASISPEEALACWQMREETLAAIREGVEDIQAGRTRPVQELIGELKNR